MHCTRHKLSGVMSSKRRGDLGTKCHKDPSNCTNQYLSRWNLRRTTLTKQKLLVPIKGSVAPFPWGKVPVNHGPVCILQTYESFAQLCMLWVWKIAMAQLFPGLHNPRDFAIIRWFFWITIKRKVPRIALGFAKREWWRTTAAHLRKKVWSLNISAQITSCASSFNSR